MTVNWVVEANASEKPAVSIFRAEVINEYNKNVRKYLYFATYFRRIY
jgi:hypothetical protein